MLYIYTYIYTQENKISSDMPPKTIDILYETISPTNMNETDISFINDTDINIMTCNTVSPLIMEHASNIEIIDKVHVENIEDTDKEKKHVQSNDEKLIEQKENKEEEFETCEIDQLQLVNAIRNLVRIYNIL